MLARAVLFSTMLSVGNLFCTTQIALYENILCADYASITNQKNADHYYQKVLQHVSSQSAQSSYCKHLYEQQEYDKIITFSKQYPELFLPGNTFEQCGFMLAFAYQATQNKLALPLLKQLVDEYPYAIEITYHLLQSLLAQESYAEVLATIQKLYVCNRQATFHYVFNFIAYQAHYALHKYVDAKENLERAIALQPKFEQGWLLMAMLEEKLGNIERAKLGYQYVFDITGDALIAQKLKFLAEGQYGTSVINHIKQALNNKRYADAQKLLDTARMQKDDALMQEYQLLQLDLYMAQKLYHAAQKLICSQIQQNVHELWLKIAHLFYLRVPDEKIKRSVRNFLLHIAYQKCNRNLLLYVFDIFLRIKHEKFSAYARTVYALVEKILPICNDSLLEQKVLFQAMNYAWHIKDYKKVAEFALHPKVLQASYVPLLNLAAYYYASKGKSPEVADKLMKVVSVSSIAEDLSLLDTHAFVLYKSGKDAEAYQCLTPVNVLVQTDATLLRHYGKICARLGKMDEARNAIEKAYSFEKNVHKKKQMTRFLAHLNKQY